MLPRVECRARLLACAVVLATAAACSAPASDRTGDGQRAPSAAESTSRAASVIGDTLGDTSLTAPVRGVEFFSAGQLGSVADALARGTTTARTLIRHANFLPIQARRSSSGVPEVHEDWIDVTWVQAGRAKLLTGGRVSGSRQQSPGEFRGGTIQGGASRAIAAGDVFIIPAGTPHQYVLEPGDTIRYLTVKVRNEQPNERAGRR